MPFSTYGFDLPSSDEWPTETDFDEAFRLTSWISNETVKFILLDYLILCPEQDMCLGPMFKRNYTFTQQPACTPCECDDSCVRRSTCCPSKFYRQTDTPDFIEYQHNVNVTENDVPLSCAEPLWNPTGIKTGKSYWMVETCPNKVICISPPSVNVSSSTPVTSLATNQTYRNMQCALCNQEEVPNLVTWEKKKICIIRSDLMSPEDISTLYQSVISESPICNVGFYPPTSTEHVVKPCVTYTYDVNCNDVELRILIDISYLTKACQENYLPYYSNRKLYKNVFCALCEFNVFDLNIQYGDRGIFDDSIITPFSALMNFQQVVEAPSTKNSRCKENQIFDGKLVSPEQFSCSCLALQEKVGNILFICIFQLNVLNTFI